MTVNRLEPKGAHVIVRTGEHVAALKKAMLATAGDTGAPCRRKKRIPPSGEALAEADRVRAALAAGGSEARELLRREGVVVIAYQAVQRAWSRA